MGTAVETEEISKIMLTTSEKLAYYLILDIYILQGKLQKFNFKVWQEN